MDLNSSYQLQQHQQDSRLLRFRSAVPSSVRANDKQVEAGAAANNANAWEDYEPERLVLRFTNSDLESNDTASPSFQEFVDRKLSNHKTATAKGFNSHLLRQSSFPADHFSNIISFQSGYDTVKGVGNYGGEDGSDGELSLSMNTLKNQTGFSPRSPSSLGMGSEGIGTSSRDDRRQGGSSGDTQYYGPKFPYDYDDQNGELGNQVHTLSHHLSLPRKSSSEMFFMDNLLQFPDSVPSNIRAKRGFATHPRSIAERVRRTRISERIRKLQELVPNIDKQASTADMLDLALEYIKDLQKQLKTLNEKRAKCRCISMQKSERNQIA